MRKMYSKKQIEKMGGQAGLNELNKLVESYSAGDYSIDEIITAVIEKLLQNGESAGKPLVSDGDGGVVFSNFPSRGWDIDHMPTDIIKLKASPTDSDLENGYLPLSSIADTSAMDEEQIITNIKKAIKDGIIEFQAVGSNPYYLILQFFTLSSEDEYIAVFGLCDSGDDAVASMQYAFKFAYSDSIYDVNVREI